MEEKAFELLLGGYYSNQEESQWSVFRILDIDNNGIHYTPYNDKFSSLPTEKQVLELKPWILHIPQEIGMLNNLKDLTLITVKPLSDQDLEGYAQYLEGATGMNPEEIKSYLTQIKTHSQNKTSVRVAFN